MKLLDAVVALKSESLKVIEDFEKHYAEHMETPDYYPEDLTYEEWQDQLSGYIGLTQEEEPI